MSDRGSDVCSSDLPLCLDPPRDTSPKILSVRLLGPNIRNPKYIPEGDGYSEEQHRQQAPGRRAGEMVDRPTDQRAATDPAQPLGQNAVTALVIRIGLRSGGH